MVVARDAQKFPSGVSFNHLSYFASLLFFQLLRPGFLVDFTAKCYYNQTSLIFGQILGKKWVCCSIGEPVRELFTKAGMANMTVQMRAAGAGLQCCHGVWFQLLHAGKSSPECLGYTAL